VSSHPAINRIRSRLSSTPRDRFRKPLGVSINRLARDIAVPPGRISAVDDPDAIRAILAAGAVSRELADRAPPFAPSLGTSHDAALSA